MVYIFHLEKQCTFYQNRIGSFKAMDYSRYTASLLFITLFNQKLLLKSYKSYLMVSHAVF